MSKIISAYASDNKKRINGVIADIDKTIVGILTESNHTLSGVMGSDGNITVNGIVPNRNVTIPASTSVLVYREYILVDLVMLFKARELLAGLLKATSVENEMQIDSAADASINKLLSPQELKSKIVSALYCALAYAVSIVNQSSILSGVDAILQKYIGVNDSDMGVAVESIGTEIIKYLDVDNRLKLDSGVDAIVLKYGDIDNVLKIVSSLNSSISKYASISNSFVLSSSLNTVLVYFRKIQDIYPLTMGDLYQWDMETLYMTTEE